jgi:hypothetical protein
LGGTALFQKSQLKIVLAAGAPCFGAEHQAALSLSKLNPHSPGNDGNGSIATSSPMGVVQKLPSGGKMRHRRKAKDKHLS